MKIDIEFYKKREEYQIEGEKIKDMPKNKRKKEFEKWANKAKKYYVSDEPIYDISRLTKWIGLVL